MKQTLTDTLSEFRGILGVCPCCGHLFRLSDLAISYHVEPTASWLDDLEWEEATLEKAEQRFEEQEARIREMAKLRANKRLPRLLRKLDPIFTRQGFYPQDVKTVFDPIDFVIFDGLNRKGTINRVVLVDHPPHTREREKIQRSIEHIVEAGNYEWRTVRVSREGIAQSDGLPNAP